MLNRGRKKKKNEPLGSGVFQYYLILSTARVSKVSGVSSFLAEERAAIGVRVSVSPHGPLHHLQPIDIKSPVIFSYVALDIFISQ